MRALIACDREAFYASEIAAREKTHYPPFGRLASLVVSGPDRPSTEGYARRLCGAALHDESVRILGPAEAPIAVIRGRHRFRVLVKAPRGYDLSAYMRDWLRGAPKAATGVKLEVDIDPRASCEAADDNKSYRCQARESGASSNPRAIDWSGTVSSTPVRGLPDRPVEPGDDTRQ